MMPQLSQAFDLSALGLASLVGLFYYGYSPFSLVAGAALDRLGPRRVMPMAAAIISLGAMLFAVGSRDLAAAGDFCKESEARLSQSELSTSHPTISARLKWRH